MAKLKYLHDGEFTIGGEVRVPTREIIEGGKVVRVERIEYPIPNELAAEVHRDLVHWEDRGFRLIDYAPAPPPPSGLPNPAADIRGKREK